MTDEFGSVPNAESGSTATEEKTLPPQKFQDEMQSMQFTLFSKMINDRNGLVAKINAAAGNKEDLLNHYRENDNSDPAIVEAREAWSQAYLHLMSLVEPKVESIIADSKGSQDEAEAAVKDLDSKLKPGLNLYKKLYADADEHAMDYFPKQERLKGAGVRAGTGVRRLRNLFVTITIDGENNGFENFSSAAKHLGWDTGDLQKAFFDKAGTDDPKKFPAATSFVVNYVENDGDNEVEKEAFVKVERTDEDEAEANEAEAETHEDESDEATDLEGLV